MECPMCHNSGVETIVGAASVFASCPDCGYGFRVEDCIHTFEHHKTERDGTKYIKCTRCGAVEEA